MDRLKTYTNKFQKLIKYETISSVDTYDKKKFDGFHNLLKTQYPTLFKKCKVEYFHGSLLIKWKGKSSSKPIMFMNHHDVVPATGDWKYPPFSATIKNGKMYSRGTLDTKGGLFAMLQAGEELIKEGFVPSNDIYFESACNEETTGAGALEIAKELKRRKVKLDFLVDEGGMIVYEPLAGVKGKYAMIGLGERAPGAIKFIAKSSGGHASTPGKDTPLVRLGKMMAYIEKHNIFEVEINDVVIEMLTRLSECMDGPTKYIYKYSRLFKPLLKIVMPRVSPVAKAMCQTTIAFTMAEGSNARNVLPETAVITADMRCSHHQGYKKSLQAVKAIASKFDIEVQALEKPFESNIGDYNCKGFKLAEKAVKATYGEDTYTAPYIMNQCSDARSMSLICDNCLRFSPFYITNKQMESIHGLNENVDINNLDKAVDFYKYMMKEN